MRGWFSRSRRVSTGAAARRRRTNCAFGHRQHASIDGGLLRLMFAGELADLATQPNAILDCFAEVKAGEDSRLAVLRLRFCEAGPAADGASRDGRSRSHAEREIVGARKLAKDL